MLHQICADQPTATQDRAQHYGDPVDGHDFLEKHRAKRPDRDNRERPNDERPGKTVPEKGGRNNRQKGTMKQHEPCVAVASGLTQPPPVSHSPYQGDVTQDDDSDGTPQRSRDMPPRGSDCGDGQSRISDRCQQKCDEFSQGTSR